MLVASLLLVELLLRHGGHFDAFDEADDGAVLIPRPA